jgi:hypothetical protein
VKEDESEGHVVRMGEIGCAYKGVPSEKTRWKRTLERQRHRWEEIYIK